MRKVLVSITGLVLCYGLVSFVAGFLPAKAFAQAGVTFGFEPTQIVTDLGDTFTVNVIAYPNGESIDTARSIVQFDDDALELQYYELGSLFPNVAPGNYVDNSDGFVSIGGYLKSKQTSDSGIFATIVFKSKLPGVSSLNFIEGTKMISIGKERIDLAASGQASVTVLAVADADIPKFFPQMAEVKIPGDSIIKTNEETGEEYEEVSALKVISLSHPNQNQWQALNDVGMSWQITGSPSVGVQDYFYTLNKEPQADPGLNNKTQETSASFEDVEDGVWYFHIKALFTNGDYSDIAHYRVLLDTQAPNPIVPVLDFETIEAGKGVYLRFRTLDQTSGINYYEIELNDKLYSTQANEMLISDLKAGKYSIVVRAFDKAGNWVAGETKLTVKGNWSVWYTFGLIAVGLLILLLILKKKTSRLGSRR